MKEERSNNMSQQPHTGTVESLRHLTPTIVELRCRTTPPLEYQAGQYVMVGFPPLGHEETTPYTDNNPTPLFPLALASAPHQPLLEFCVRLDEANSMYPHLQPLKPGDALTLHGPFGDFHYHNPHQHRVVFIATGTGIAPLRAMMRSRDFQNSPPAHTTLLLGVRNANEFLHQDEWQAVHAEVIPVLSQAADPWQGERGWVTDYLQSAPDALFASPCQYYLCGQPDMLQTASTLLHQRGVPADAIFLSQ